MPWFDELLNDIGQAALIEAGVTADPDAIAESILTLADEMATIFGTRMTETSRRLVFTVAESWLQTPGANKKQLLERMERIWTGPRPDAAATTETTRLVARGRQTAWAESGVVWGYQPIHKNDDRVRTTHRENAANGPYPTSDLDHLPPYGDVNCRCSVVAVLDEPS